jgi:hypothetical protein
MSKLLCHDCGTRCYAIELLATSMEYTSLSLQHTKTRVMWQNTWVGSLIPIRAANGRVERDRPRFGDLLSELSTSLKVSMEPKHKINHRHRLEILENWGSTRKERAFIG